MKVIKLLILVFILFFGIASAEASMDLSQHGPQLIKAPFPIRYRFEMKHHKSWLKSTYDERKEFLTEWYTRQKDEETAAKEKAKAELDAQRELQNQKKEEKKRLEEMDKESQRAKLNEAKETETQKKDFDKVVTDQQRQLERLQKLTR
ncbi:MAG: hypothetical protein HQL15_08160 [Candidatus Omnitrophica bacterium]|nr:hypothetical protein [Candidatus Omnitrophota bacterium]